MLRSIAWVFKKGTFPLFIMVGAINTLFGYTIFATGIYCGLHYIIASLLALCLGIVFNFHTIGKIVFNRFDSQLIFKFIAVYGVIYLLNISLLKLDSFLIENIYLNGLIVTIFIAVISFLLNKNIVFRK